MVDTRIYRAAFVPVLVAVVVLMFSLEPAPAPLQGPVSTPAFEASDAAKLTRQIVQLAPDRTPGSEGDQAVADFVADRFANVAGGEVAEQRFDTSFDGEDVEAENVVMTIPGQSEETLLVVAPRDSAAGDGATTSAAATGTLLTLSEALGNSRHNRTLILASTSGSVSGGKGIRELVDQLPGAEQIEAAIVIAQPAVEERHQPFVFTGHAGPDSVPAVLFETADSIATTQFGEDAAPSGGWAALSRLAIPVGIGEAAALADEGVDAIAVSGSGERPPTPGEADGARVSTETLSMAGTTALNLLLTLDETEQDISKGPQEYVRLGSNIVPGWTFGLLAIALVLPALIAAFDVWLRDRRRNPRQTRRSIPWVLERVLLPLAALLLAYLLGLFGLIPGPDFPYDPSDFPAGAEAPITFALLALAVVLVAILVRPNRTPLDSEPQTLAAAAGILGALSLVGIWLINPYLALLATPAVHVWALVARAQGPPRRLVIALVALLSLVPAVAAFAKVASSLGLGLTAPWHLLLLLVDGQFGFLMALLWCGLLGALIACVGAAGAKPSGIGGTTGGRAPSVRGPSGYAGPGSLGGTPSMRARS